VRGLGIEDITNQKCYSVFGVYRHIQKCFLHYVTTRENKRGQSER
jgi:hypothetical protein